MATRRGAGRTVAALGWLQGTLLGHVATTVAVIAIAMVGFMMLTGEAPVTTDDLLQASLRLRPDRIVLGVLRGVEAVSFLRAINPGHPGSFSTIHANSLSGALEQLALMVMQARLGLSRMNTLAYAKSAIDVVVQLDRQDGRRGIAAVTPTSNL